MPALEGMVAVSYPNTGLGPIVFLLWNRSLSAGGREAATQTKGDKGLRA